MADAIEKRLPAVAPLTSTDESRKGGSIQYGMWEAAQRDFDGQTDVYTDADLSTHLGQSGLLLEPVLGGAGWAAGSRREPTSVVIKRQARDQRGKLFIYLWKQMLPVLGRIIDTQCGFKGFPASGVESLVEGTIERCFAFDTELLLRTELRRPGSIEAVAVAWIDSEALSTTTSLRPYLPMLKAVAAMYSHYLPPSAPAQSFAQFVEALDEDDWSKLLAAAPTEMTEREPREFADFAGVTAADLQTIIS